MEDEGEEEKEMSEGEERTESMLLTYNSTQRKVVSDYVKKKDAFNRTKAKRR